MPITLHCCFIWISCIESVMDRSITFPFSHLLFYLLSLLSLRHLCSTHLSLGPIPTIHPKTFRHCPCLSFVFFSVWLLWQQDTLGLLLFFWWCRGKCDPTEEKGKIKRTAWGIELPGNNFPPLCKSAFIILQWGLLKTPVEKFRFVNAGERYKEKGEGEI